MVNEKLINKVRNFCATVPPELQLQDVYIFAPESKGYKFDDLRPNIALVFAHISSFHEVEYRLHELLKWVDIDFELQILEESEMNIENPLAWEILNHSVEVVVGKMESEVKAESSTTQQQK